MIIEGCVQFHGELGQVKLLISMYTGISNDIFDSFPPICYD